MIYYSGYGVKDYRGDLFFAFKDTDLDILRATALSNRFLLEELAASRSRFRVLILDCAYSGGVLRGATVPNEIVILTASGPVEYAFESESRPQSGLFTQGLIEGLRTGDADLDGDGSITFDELFLYSKRRVEILTDGSQTPRIFSLTEKPIVASKVARPIFISYSRSDMGFALELGGKLREAGHKVWIDTKGIPGGHDWRVRITSAIEASKLVLIILSPEALESEWVQRELNYADKLKKPILPVVSKASSSLPPWFDFQFGQLQRVDLTGPIDDESLQTVLSSIKEVLRSRTP